MYGADGCAAVESCTHYNSIVKYCRGLNTFGLNTFCYAVEMLTVL